MVSMYLLTVIFILLGDQRKFHLMSRKLNVRKYLRDKVKVTF